MPPEIADSDEESDVILHEDITHHTSPSGTRLRGEVSEHNDPTQKLSDLSSSTHKSTCSTERLMRGLREAAYDGFHDPALPSPAMTSSSNAKRAVSDIPSPVTEMTDGPKTKRCKTYGSRTRDLGSDIFAVQPTLEEPFTDRWSNDPPAGTPLMAAANTIPPESATRERDRPRRVVSLLQQNITNPYHQVTTSMSSVGGYQSINLDFRGDGRGLDLNTNLFGSISQVSVEGAPDASEAPKATNDTQNQQLSDLFDELTQPNIHSQMTTSPNGPASPLRPLVEPLSEGETCGPPVPEPGAQLSDLSEVMMPSKRRKSDHPRSDAAKAPSEGTVRRASSLSAEWVSVASDLPPPKKRGRPSKAKVMPESELDELPPLMGPPPVDTGPEVRVRAVALEMPSQTSQVSQAASNTKHKRKQTEPEIEPASAEPKQHPSSEINLSDEQFIGLPKENYKPRPSRSRSKRTDDGEQPQEMAATPRKDPNLGTVDPVKISTPASRPSTVKVKKSKVKRAKTSATALLKASEPMLSDGEEDVLWVDTKPAAVKLDLPLEIRLSKTAQIDHDEESADELHSEIAAPKRAAFSLEIPLHAGGQSDGSSDKKTPKKRGRKPKKSAAVSKPSEGQDPSSVATPSDQVAPVAEQDEVDRLPLAAKDANKPPAKANNNFTKSNKHKPIITDSDDEENDENNAPAQPPAQTVSSANDSTTAEPPRPATTTTTTPSPTKAVPSPTRQPAHSPLKTTSAMASQRYRIGLSKRTKIPSLLRKVQRDKPPPTKTGVKVKELKIKGVNDGGDNDDGDGGDGEGAKWTGVLRDKDGRLVEWDF